MNSDGSRNKSTKMVSGLSWGENFTTSFAPSFRILPVHTKCRVHDSGLLIYLARQSGQFLFFSSESSQSKTMRLYFSTSTTFYWEQLLLGLGFMCGGIEKNNYTSCIYFTRCHVSNFLEFFYSQDLLYFLLIY